MGEDYLKLGMNNALVPLFCAFQRLSWLTFWLINYGENYKKKMYWCKSRRQVEKAISNISLGFHQLIDTVGKLHAQICPFAPIWSFSFFINLVACYQFTSLRHIIQIAGMNTHWIAWNEATNCFSELYGKTSKQQQQ